MSKSTIINYIYSSVYFVYTVWLKTLLKKYKKIKNSVLDLGQSLLF